MWLCHSWSFDMKVLGFLELQQILAGLKTILDERRHAKQ
jgi:hypothetical protein